MNRLLMLCLLCVMTLTTSGCGLRDQQSAEHGNGSIGAEATWNSAPLAQQHTAAMPANAAPHRVAPSGVYTMKMIVSNGTKSYSQTFAATPNQPGSGTIGNVNYGTYTVTLAGLDSSHTLVYYGAASNVTIGSSQPTATCPIILSSAIPQNVTAIPAPSQVTLNWIAVSGASSYTVYVSTSPGVSPTNYSAQYSTTDTSAVLSSSVGVSLLNGVTYYFVVAAVTNAGETAPSSAISAIPAAPPSAPASVLAAPASSTAIITWGSTTGAVSYRVYRATTSANASKTNGTLVGSPATTTFIDSALTNSATYYYVVTAYSGTLESAESSVVSVQPTANITMLASGSVNPKGVAVDATSAYLYWADNKAVKRTYLATKTTTTVTGSLTNPLYLAVDASNVYFTEYSSSGAVKQVPLGGGAVTTIASGLSYPYNIKVTATTIYWTEVAVMPDSTGSGVLKMAPIGGGTVTTLMSGLNNPTGLALDGANAYVSEQGNSANSGTIRSVPLTGGTTSILASGLDYPYDVAVDAGYVYWAENSLNSAGQIRKLALTGTGSSPVTLASSLVSPYDIALDANNIYWVDLNVVSGISISASDATPIAVAPTNYNRRNYYAGLTDIAVDGTNAYWTDRTAGVVMQAVKARPVSAPSGVTAVADNLKNIISWNSVTDATSYNIYYSTTPGNANKTSGTKISNVTSAYTHTALTYGMTYYYAVTAVGLTESAESVVVNATPTASLVTVFTTSFDSGIPVSLSGVTTTESVQGYSAYGFSGMLLRNNSTGNPASATTLTLSGLPSHSHIAIEFLLAIIDTWDGNNATTDGPDYFNVRVDGAVVYSQTYSNSLYSQSATTSNRLVVGTNIGWNSWDQDSAYNMGDPAAGLTNIPHSASTVTIDFYASGPHWSGASDESWGMDNLTVRVY